MNRIKDHSMPPGHAKSVPFRTAAILALMALAMTLSAVLAGAQGQADPLRHWLRAFGHRMALGVPAGHR
ncbi:MAG TPA: hypothetical protein VEN79_14230 [Terriglobia bacterium]|nr:hypothetical protein [Terriglobia bacterium]